MFEEGVAKMLQNIFKFDYSKNEHQKFFKGTRNKFKLNVSYCNTFKSTSRQYCGHNKQRMIPQPIILMGVNHKVLMSLSTFSLEIIQSLTSKTLLYRSFQVRSASICQSYQLIKNNANCTKFIKFFISIKIKDTIQNFQF